MSYGSDFPELPDQLRYLYQGRAPFEWICRGKVCYEPVNFSALAAAGTAEETNQLCAILRGIDFALGAGSTPEDLTTEDGTVLTTEDGTALTTEG